MKSVLEWMSSTRSIRFLRLGLLGPSFAFVLILSTICVSATDIFVEADPQYRAADKYYPSPSRQESYYNDYAIRPNLFALDETSSPSPTISATSAPSPTTLATGEPSLTTTTTKHLRASTLQPIHVPKPSSSVTTLNTKDLPIVRVDVKTLSPSATLITKGESTIPSPILISSVPTLSPSAAASAASISSTGAPTMRPSANGSIVTIVGNWAEIPPFDLELSFMLPFSVNNFSLSQDVSDKLTLYLGNFFSQWLINNTHIPEVDVYLELLTQGQRRVLLESSTALLRLQFSGGYAIFYEQVSTNNPTQTFDNCQMTGFLHSAFTGASGLQLVSFLKEQPQILSISNITVFQYLSSLNLQGKAFTTAPSPGSNSPTIACGVLNEATLVTNNDTKMNLTSIILISMFAFAIGIILGVLMLVLLKRRSKRIVESSVKLEVAPVELLAQSNHPSIPKLGTSQSTEVATNVRSTNKRSVDYVLSRFNNNATSRSVKTSSSSGSSVGEFSQGFQVVAARQRSTTSSSKYISPASSSSDEDPNEEETLQVSIDDPPLEDCLSGEDISSNDDCGDDFDWEVGVFDDEFSIDADDVSKWVNPYAKSKPSFDDVPFDEERMDQSTRHAMIPSEEEYHDVLDIFTKELNVTESPIFRRQDFHSTHSKVNNGDIDFIFRQRQMSSVADS